MSALFAFEVGDVSMRSATFENVIRNLLESSSEPVDRQVCLDALELNCLWVDQIAESRKCAVIVNLHSVLIGQLGEGNMANEVAKLEIQQMVDELSQRYPECFD